MNRALHLESISFLSFDQQTQLTALDTGSAWHGLKARRRVKVEALPFGRTCA
jgi:hypothetical protein